ncbi:U-box domain-containing protein 7-like protein [Tanacetum coccineum]
MADASSTSSSWYQVYVKLKFFTKIRRFVHKRRGQVSGQSNDVQTIDIAVDKGKTSESINHGDDDDNGIMQKSVKRLHFGSKEEKAIAAIEIKRLARDDLKRRKLMADLGVIQPLVAMIGSDYIAAHRRLAIQALLELANGTCT